MMSKCGKCGTSWTSLGMTMCPICGAKVEGPSPSAREACSPARTTKSARREKKQQAAYDPSASTTVLEAPPVALPPDQGISSPKGSRQDPGADVLRGAELRETAQQGPGPKGPVPAESPVAARTSQELSGPPEPKNPTPPARTPLPATEEPASAVPAPVPEPSAAAASGAPSGNVRATVADADSIVRP